LASNLLWFEDDQDDPEDALLEGDDADMDDAEREEERRMLKGCRGPDRRCWFRGGNAVYKEASR
jgi:hypothetical protein